MTTKNTDRFEQTSLSAERIDREAGIIYGVRVMKEKSDHGYAYSLAAQKPNVRRYEQMPVGISHDYDSKPMTVQAAWGTLFNPRMDSQGTLADLRYLQSDPLSAKIIEDAEWQLNNPDKPGIFSLSAVTHVRREQSNVVTEFVPVRVDVVVRGATVKRFFEQTNPGDSEMETETTDTPKTAEEHTAAALHSALDAVLADDSAGKDKAKKLAKIIKAMHDDEEEEEEEEVETETATETETPAAETTETETPAADNGKTEKTEDEIKEEEDKAAAERTEQAANKAKYDALAQRFEQLRTKTAELEKRMVLHEQFVEPRTTVQQAIEKTTAKINLETFWDSSIPASK